MYLARQNATTLAMLGSGIQARYHLRAIRHALPFLKSIRVFSPTEGHRLRYAAEMSEQMGWAITAAGSAREAVNDADIVCITATGREPVIEASWLRPGALVISITGLGLPPDLVTRVVVPALAGPVVRPSGWDPQAVMTTMGDRDPSTVATTLAAVMRGEGQARLEAKDIVLYEQRGAYAWDALLLRWIYNWAVEHHAGTAFHLTSEANALVTENSR
jgi:ornithine cyclodeaminase/alanine dehydrogenase-like protein (mu-crystallin family)